MVSHLQLQRVVMQAMFIHTSNYKGKPCKLCLFTPPTTKGSHASYVYSHLQLQREAMHIFLQTTSLSGETCSSGVGTW